MSLSTHSSQRGRRASHTFRPCRISRSENAPRSSGGTSALRACSAFTASVSLVSLSRIEQAPDVGVDREAGQAERDGPDHVAGLAADARERHEILQLGRHLPVESLLERGTHSDQALRLLTEEAGGVDELLDVRRLGLGKVAGRRIRANTAGVTLLTISSVLCADRIVATSSWYGLSWWSAHSSAALPGYSSARRSTTVAARACRTPGSCLRGSLTRRVGSLGSDGGRRAHRPPTADDLATIAGAAADRSQPTVIHRSATPSGVTSPTRPTGRSCCSRRGQRDRRLPARMARADDDRALAPPRSSCGRPTVAGTEHLLVDAALTELAHDGAMHP